MPIFIILLAARIMVNPGIRAYEYAKPDFPPDTYGFTQARAAGVRHDQHQLPERAAAA